MYVGVAGSMLCRWLRAVHSFYVQKCRRIGCSLWLLIAIQLALTVVFIVKYDIFADRSGDETAERMAVCRREFIRSYDDFCRHSFRPHPSNVINRYLTAFSSSGLTPSTRNLDLCPCVPFDGETTMQMNRGVNLTWNEVLLAQTSSQRLPSPHVFHDEHQNTATSQRQQLMPGGRWMPLWCIPRQSVAVIVPFRARDQHLNAFINHLHPFLRSQLLDFIIIVVEQGKPELFNRGSLLNVGFKEAQRLAAEDAGSSIDCFIFHDVDKLPTNRLNFYVCSQYPRHMAAYRGGWNHSLLYQTFFGGVNSFRAEHFELINGFSNKFYGWGGEDDDLLHRVNAKKLALSDRYPKCVSKYWENFHEQDVGNPTGVDKDLGILYRPEEYDSDGLNTLRYSVRSRRDMTLYTRITVDLPDKQSVAVVFHATWRMTVILLATPFCLVSVTS